MIEIHTIIFSIIGTLFLIGSTYLFSFSLPKIQTAINSYIEAIESMSRNYNLYHATKIKITVLEGLSKLESNRDERVQEKIFVEELNALVYAYTATFNEVPSQKRVNDWKKMNISSLLKEEKYFFEMDKLKGYLKIRLVLDAEKNYIQNLAIALQISGLILFGLSNFLVQFFL